MEGKAAESNGSLRFPASIVEGSCRDHESACSMAHCLGPSIQARLPAVDGVSQSEARQTVELSQPQSIRDVHADILCNLSPTFEEVCALHHFAPFHRFFSAPSISFSVPSAHGPPYCSQTRSQPFYPMGECYYPLVSYIKAFVGSSPPLTLGQKGRAKREGDMGTWFSMF